MNETLHIPVMLTESVKMLQVTSGKKIVDCTFGFGGHSSMLLAQGAEVLGIDLDMDAIRACRHLQNQNQNLHCFHGSFSKIDFACYQTGWDKCDGILLDLGVSSYQIDDSNKGFTYRNDSKLDMRFDQTSGKSAKQLIDGSSEEELANVIFRFGEERKSRRIAREIINANSEGNLQSTQQLAKCVETVVGKGPNLKSSLSRVFQAIRMAVNDELAVLSSTLEKSIDCLAPEGRLAVISYHSLEDRIVKKFFNINSKDCLCPPEFPECRCSHKSTLKLVNKKPITASADELKANPRSRSAKLRVVERLK